MKKFSPKYIAYIGLLTALEIILSRFLSFNVWNMKIGFNFVPIVIGAMLFGPLAGGIIAALGDFLGAILFPIGAYFPGFTLTAFLTGMVFGLFLYKKPTILKTVGAVAVNQLVLSLLLNTLWISILYGSPYLPLLVTRLVQCAILIPVQIVVIIILNKGVIPRLKRAKS